MRSLQEALGPQIRQKNIFQPRRIEGGGKLLGTLLRKLALVIMLSPTLFHQMTTAVTNLNVAFEAIHAQRQPLAVLIDTLPA